MFIIWCLIGAWNGRGKARLTAQTSNFIQIRMSLIYYAQQNGHYPKTLKKIAKTPALKEVGEENLVYTASLKKYDSATIRLFYEKEPHRYGFKVGFFDSYSNGATKFRELKDGQKNSTPFDWNKYP